MRIAQTKWKDAEAVLRTAEARWKDVRMEIEPPKVKIEATYGKYRVAQTEYFTANKNLKTVKDRYRKAIQEADRVIYELKKKAR